MNFKKITIKSWQQFGSIDISFNERLTVLTGANGSGKTTILNILARHFGWQTQSLAIPEKDKILQVWKWITGLFLDEDKDMKIIGEIEYSDGAKAELLIPKQSSAQYSIEIKKKQELDGFFIPSHRSIFRYQALTNIPTQGTIDKRQAFERVSNSNKGRYFGGGDYSTSFHVKETLIAWNVFGRGNEDMEPNEKLFEYYKGFEDTLKIILPKEIGFKRFLIRSFELVLECDSGNFIIDAASGGISALIDIAWQIYMYSTEKNIFTVLIDEVENHLYPIMQRRILNDFIKAFPNVHFIVSTHSPLIVGSVKNSEVYVLKFNNDKKIINLKLDLLNKAKTAAEILDEVLGVSFTMPVWVEEKLKEIIAKYASLEIADKTFSDMKAELSEVGLEKLIPEAIVGLTEKKDDKN